MATSEDWIGKQIGKQVVCSWVGGGGVRGELVEVSDRGVVLNVSVAHSPRLSSFAPGLESELSNSLALRRALATLATLSSNGHGAPVLQ